MHTPLTLATFVLVLFYLYRDKVKPLDQYYSASNMTLPRFLLYDFFLFVLFYLDLALDLNPYFYCIKNA